MKKHILNTLAFLLLVAPFSSTALSKELVIGLSSAPSNLSPFFATDAYSQNINRLLFLTLTDFDQNMDFVCRACENFKEEFRGEKHVLSFKLKSGLTFWDGTPVTVKDVENSWRLFIDEESPKSIFRFSFSKIESFKVTAPDQIEITYPKYTADNLSDLALLKILKIKTGGSPTNIADIIGSGPYRFDHSSALGVLIKPVGSSDAPELNFKVVKDETTLALKMMNHEIDLSVAQLSPRKVDWIQKNVEHLNIIKERGTNFIYIGLNHKNKHLAKLDFRKALDHLIPRDKLVRYKMKTTAVLANSLFSPSFTDLFQSDLRPVSQDVEKAKKLLAGLGYGWEGGRLAYEGKPVALEWKVSNNKASEEVVDAMIDEFAKIGLQVRKTVQEWGTFMHSMKTGQFDLVMSQWVGFTGPGMLSYVFASESFPPSGANRGFFSNQKLDQLLSAATGPMTKEQRYKNYRAATAIAVNERAYLNLWHPDIIWIARECLKRVSPYPNGNFLPLLDIDMSDCHERK